MKDASSLHLRRLLASLAISILIPAGSSTASTPVSGTWTAANSPYRVADTLVVPAGDALVIEPGVDVLFDADVPLIVEGRLLAVGTETDSIRFLPSAAGEWKGIRISGRDSSALAFMRIGGGNADGADALTKQGGGICLSGTGTHLALTHSVIAGNRAIHGGGISISAGTQVAIEHCTIRNNTSYGYGGGMQVSNARVGIRTTRIENNRAPWPMAGSYAPGGAIAASSADIEMTDCILRGNSSAAGGGGAVRFQSGRLTMERCLVAGNTTSAYGGGFWFADNANATLAHCTIAGNVGRDGATPASGIGVSSSALALKSSIVWGNGPQAIASLGASTVSVTYSDVAGGWPGVGNIAEDPLFVDMVDYVLSPGSPCIDRGDPAGSSDPDGSRADMGWIGGIGQVPVEADTSGDVSGVWLAANSPYHVADTLRVPVGRSLVIEPGVDVLFDADVPFLVEGRLVALGTETDSIRFLPGAAGEWKGIRISGRDSSALAFVRISGDSSRGYGALRIARARISVSNSRITGNRDHGMQVREGGRATIDSCRISDNRGSGIGVLGTGTIVAIRRCEFERNDGRGIYVSDTAASATVSDCTIRSNGIGGLYAQCRSLRVTRCTIADHTGYWAPLAIDGQDSLYRDDPGFRIAAVVENCVIVDNRVSGYYVVATDHSDIVFRNCTIARNKCASESRGAMAILGGTNARVVNCLFAENTAGDIRVPLPLQAMLFVEYCLTQRAWPGTGNFVAEPRFLDPDGGDWSFAPGSPGVDAGSPYYLDADSSRSDVGHTGGMRGTAPIPRISVDRDTLDVFDAKPRSLRMENTGAADLTIDRVELPDSVRIVDTSFPIRVPPRMSREFAFLYDGRRRLDARARIIHDDAFAPPAEVLLRLSPGREISGIARGRWTAGTYHVVDTLRVPAGDSLVIEPGVDVLFDADVPFIVEGRLRAVGTETDSIRFLAGRSSWRGISFLGRDSSTLAWARISGASTYRNPGDDDRDHGGGMRLAGDGVRVGMRHCVVSANVSYYRGGGIAAIGTGLVLTLDSCRISGNRSYDTGGLTAFRKAVVAGGYGPVRIALNDCVVSGNFGENNAGFEMYESDTWFRRCEIVGNRSYGGYSGGEIMGACKALVEECTIAGNASDAWGAAFNAGPEAEVTLRGTAIIGNTVYDGTLAGVESYQNLRLENVTIAGNRGTLYSVMQVHVAAGKLTARNSIIWGDVGYNLDLYIQKRAKFDVAYCAVSADILAKSGANNLRVLPGFVDAAAGDFALAPGSPLIDAGDPAAPRDPDGSRADIGAFPSPYGTPLATAETHSRSAFSLAQNVPNPFNPSTIIPFSLPATGHATLAIYTIHGQRVRILIDGFRPAGAHEVTWDGRDATGRPVSSGVYVYRLRLRDDRELVRRMTLIR